MRKRRLRSLIYITAAFIALAAAVHMGWTAGAEAWVYARIAAHISPPLTAAMRLITYVGDLPAVIAICVILLMIPRTSHAVALPSVFATIISTFTNMLLKDLFARERPDIMRLIAETGYSFPSGHAMINATLYTMLALRGSRRLNQPKQRVLVVACALITVTIGLSRVYLGVHYAGDILAGWLLGVAIAIGVDLLWSKEEQV